MVTVKPGTNLLIEAVEKVVRNQGLRFNKYYQGINVLDPEDKTHTCGLIFKDKMEVNRVIAQIDCRSGCSVTVFLRNDLEFAKQLAENISSASGTTVTYDLQRETEDRARYTGRYCDCFDCGPFVKIKSIS